VGVQRLGRDPAGAAAIAAIPVAPASRRSPVPRSRGKSRLCPQRDWPRLWALLGRDPVGAGQAAHTASTFARVAFTDGSRVPVANGRASPGSVAAGRDPAGAGPYRPHGVHVRPCRVHGRCGQWYRRRDVAAWPRSGRCRHSRSHRPPFARAAFTGVVACGPGVATWARGSLGAFR